MKITINNRKNLLVKKQEETRRNRSFGKEEALAKINIDTDTICMNKYNSRWLTTTRWKLSSI